MVGIPGSGGDKLTDLTWIGLATKKVGKHVRNTCSFLGCNRAAAAGCHVRPAVNPPPFKAYIVAGCHQHNSKETHSKPVELKPGTLAVEIDAHESYKINGPSPSA